jgi:hypothetical protein
MSLTATVIESIITMTLNTLSTLGDATQKGLYHSLDGVSIPKYKLWCFLATIIFLQSEESTNFYTGIGAAI